MFNVLLELLTDIYIYIYNLKHKNVRSNKSCPNSRMGRKSVDDMHVKIKIKMLEKFKCFIQ